MDHACSATLAHSACGHVKICDFGCVHVTFGQVTLHLESSDELETLSHSLTAQAQETGAGVHVAFSWFSVNLTDHGYFEFARLLRNALSNLAWRRGEYTFTDQDLSEIRRFGDPA